jgi:hypothetical protein
MTYVVKFTLLFRFYFIQIYLWSFQELCVIECFIVFICLVLFCFVFCLGHLPFSNKFSFELKLEENRTIDVYKEYMKKLIFWICLGYKKAKCHSLVDIFNFHSLHIRIWNWQFQPFHPCVMIAKCFGMFICGNQFTSRKVIFIYKLSKHTQVAWILNLSLYKLIHQSLQMQAQNSLCSLFDLSANCDMMQPFFNLCKKKKVVMKIKATNTHQINWFTILTFEICLSYMYCQSFWFASRSPLSHFATFQWGLI